MKSGISPEATSCAPRMCPLRTLGFIAARRRKNASPFCSPMLLTSAANQRTSVDSIARRPFQRGCKRSSYVAGSSDAVTRRVL